MKTTKVRPFSDELEAWLQTKGPKTLDELGRVFGEKSFAITFLLLMSIPALPIPTGGITHAFEIITMLLALEQVIGQRSIWLPKRWKHFRLGKTLTHKALPFILKRIRWFEKFSRPRLGGWLRNSAIESVTGLVIFGLTAMAFLAPPFSGLDTLPALGIVFIALGVILEDIVGALIGLVIGIVGVGLVIGLGTAIFTAF